MARFLVDKKRFWLASVLVLVGVLFFTTQYLGATESGGNPLFENGIPDKITCFDCEDSVPAGGEDVTERGTCDCETGGTDSDCHYEFVPASACIAQYLDHSANELEWYWTSATDGGLRKYNADSDRLLLVCPIPSSYGYNADTYFGYLHRVVAWFYNATGGGSYYSNLYVYTHTEDGNRTYLGGTSTTSSGNVGISVDVSSTPDPLNKALIYVQDHTSSSFLGLRVCYDHDG